ncbi:tetratricopeptide repeat protein [uncultured Caulobacter sp.]|uniref:tetratricopeptide repeat protein n=1 Tax=uncultured Caulobacter sp. TaxID=158749 RepID=UPI002634CAFE|nr:tetratricopeptide repeat protein [uncultured Caulobacter sp.]
MVDVFDEVEEQLRSERYRSLAVKSLPWVAAAAAAVVIGVGGYWGWTSYQTGQANKASEAYQTALETAQKDGPDKAFGQFKAVADGGARGYKALALLQMGDIRVEQNKAKEAVAYFDEAAKAAPSPILGDLARLKSAFALMDTAPYKDIEARLTPLAGEKSPYRVYAKEALAFAKLQAGDLAGARGDFVVLANSLDNSSDEVRQRAQAAMQMIDSGSAKDLAAAVKAAAALPATPPALIPPGAVAAPNAAAGAPQ